MNIKYDIIIYNNNIQLYCSYSLLLYMKYFYFQHQISSQSCYIDITPLAFIEPPNTQFYSHNFFLYIRQKLTKLQMFKVNNYFQLSLITLNNRLKPWRLHGYFSYTVTSVTVTRLYSYEWITGWETVTQWVNTL